MSACQYSNAKRMNKSSSKISMMALMLKFSLCILYLDFAVRYLSRPITRFLLVPKQILVAEGNRWYRYSGTRQQSLRGEERTGCKGTNFALSWRLGNKQSNSGRCGRAFLLVCSFMSEDVHPRLDRLTASRFRAMDQ